MNTTTAFQTLESNPFALMMDPDAVFAALAQSDRLSRLHSRICRPLDKVIIPKTEAASLTTGDADDIELAGEVYAAE